MKRHLHALIFGWTVTFLLFVFTSVLITLCIRFTLIEENTVNWLTLLVGLLIMLTGGLLTGLKSGQKGWLMGLLLGSGFTLFVFLVQYLGFSQSFGLKQTIDHLSYIAAAMLGGIFGVNTSSVEPTETN